MDFQLIRDIQLYEEIVKRNLNNPANAMEVQRKIQDLAAEQSMVPAGTERWVAIGKELTKHIAFIYALDSFKKLLQQVRKNHGINSGDNGVA